MRLSRLPVLTQEIAKWQEAVLKTPPGDPGRLVNIYNLGFSLGERIQLTGNMEDSRLAVELLSEAASMYPRDGTQRYILLNLVAYLLLQRQLGDQESANLEYEEARRVTQEAFDETDPEYSEWELCLKRFVVLRFMRYAMTMDKRDLDELIRALDGVLGKQPSDTLYRSTFETLSVLLGKRYSTTADIADLDSVIVMLQGAVREIPDDNPARVKWLLDLSVRLGQKFFHTGDVEYLTEAIHINRQAINSNQQCDASTRAKLLINLAGRLGNRHDFTGSMEDLDEAIRVLQGIDQMDPIDRVKQLSNLGVQLGSRWFRTRQNKDLEESILLTREALDAIRPDHFEDLSKIFGTFGIQLPTRNIREAGPPEYMLSKAKLLNNLGIRLGDKYSTTNDLKYLEEAVFKLQEAIEIAPAQLPERIDFLANLGHRLYERYTRTGNKTDLSKAISVTEEADKTAIGDNARRAKISSYLGLYLKGRYSLTGEVEDLRLSSSKTRDAVSMAPKDHPERQAWKNNLGLRLHEVYSYAGAIVDLEEAIGIGREVLDTTPLDHPDRASRLSNLALYLSDKYLRFGAMPDIDESIRLTEEAIKATTQQNTQRPSFLHNLASRLGDKYSRTFEVELLDQAINILQEAIKITPKGHPDLMKWSMNLGLQLSTRYSHNKNAVDKANGNNDENTVPVYDTRDLEAAYNIVRSVAEEIPSGHTQRAAVLNNLGILLLDRYLNSRNAADIDNTIRTTRECLEATPRSHLSRAKRLINHANCLCARYVATQQSVDLEEARKCLIEALDSPSASIHYKLQAGRLFLLTHDVLADPRTYNAVKKTIELIPLLTPRSLQNMDKRYVLSNAVGISSSAAAVALHSDKGALEAINCLETGRAIIAGAILQQHDVTLLNKSHPQLAASFIDLRDQLDSPDPRESGFAFDDEEAAMRDKAAQRGKVDQELCDLLQEIRFAAGFESFLLPPSQADMLDAARHGPIIILNISLYRSDALIVQESGFTSLPLNVDPDDLNVRIEDLDSAGMLEMLQWLWEYIVYPVLDEIGLTKPSPGCSLPRVWWVPTGKLTRFPLHAAGIYNEMGDGETAIDMVVSSYAASVKAIVHGHRQQRQQETVDADTNGDLLRRVVTVAMDKTEDMDPLPDAPREIEEVLRVLSLTGSRDHQPEKVKEDVLSAVKGCQVFHFAGHGHTDAKEPLLSSLLLEDWKKAPLTVQSLLDADLEAAAPFLAYLSACGTGRIKDDGTVDESVHLVNAFQLIGFRHVIGTLWSVQDEVCVSMARMIYEYLRENGTRSECVSRGLHLATTTLRTQWLQENSSGERGPRAKMLDGPAHKALWVPFVHYGV